MNDRWIEINIPYHEFESRSLAQPGTIIKTDKGIFFDRPYQSVSWGGDRNRQKSWSLV